MQEYKDIRKVEIEIWKCEMWKNMRYANTSVWVWEGVRWEGSGDLGWEWEVRDYDTAGHHRYTTSDLVFGSGYFEPCVCLSYFGCVIGFSEGLWIIEKCPFLWSY